MKNKIKFFFSQLKFNPNKNYYQILNLTNKSTQEEIKTAYYTLAKLYHPDKNPDQIDKFKAINEAYEVLKNPSTKKDYDESQVDPQQYQKKQYDRQYHQHSTYSYQQNVNHEQFRRMYEEYKRQQTHYEYQYHSKASYGKDDPFKQYKKYTQEEQFELYSGRAAAMRYLMIFMLGMAGYVFFELFGLIMENRQIVVVDQNTGQQYVTTKDEFRRIQQKTRDQMDYERRRAILKQIQDEELRMMRQNQQQTEFQK
ncbi:unnamed protein product [Paramecium octaurelia]|uniref:J domain-containing protein n=1 Tax=Paramecium octaurelia TaxID=43137 RepID=A0A8S1V0B1_PAROT|nr:unnamed protein product [Paramecium octaurelia]